MYSFIARAYLLSYGDLKVHLEDALKNELHRGNILEMTMYAKEGLNYLNRIDFILEDPNYMIMATNFMKKDSDFHDLK